MDSARAWIFGFLGFALGLLAFGALYSSAGRVSGIAERAQLAQGQRDLRRVLDSQTDAWNRGDLDGFMTGYTRRGALTFFSGDTITTGWQPTLDRYKARYQQGGNQMGKLSFSDETIEMLSASSAVVTARWHLEMPGGEKRSGLTTLLCKKLPEGWRIVHDHSS